MNTGKGEGIMACGVIGRTSVSYWWEAPEMGKSMFSIKVLIQQLILPTRHIRDDASKLQPNLIYHYHQTKEKVQSVKRLN